MIFNHLTGFCPITLCAYVHDIIESWRHNVEAENNSINFFFNLSYFLEKVLKILRIFSDHVQFKTENISTENSTH